MTRPHRSGAERLERGGEGGNGWAGHAEPGQDWGFVLEGGESPGGLWAEPLLTLPGPELPISPTLAWATWGWQCPCPAHPTPPHGHQGPSKAGGRGREAEKQGGIMGEGQLLPFGGTGIWVLAPHLAPYSDPRGPQTGQAQLSAASYNRSAREG